MSQTMTTVSGIAARPPPRGRTASCAALGPLPPEDRRPLPRRRGRRRAPRVSMLSPDSWAAFQTRSRPSRASSGASTARPYLASWRRWKLAWLAGMPSVAGDVGGSHRARPHRARRGSGCGPGGRSRAARGGRGPAAASGARSWGQPSRLRTYIAQVTVRNIWCGYGRLPRLARNHDFTVLWAGATVSELGSRMSLFVFPLLAYRAHRVGAGRGARRRSPSARAGRGAAAGRRCWADRTDRRELMRSASAVGTACCTPRWWWRRSPTR